jgi:tetratricopeptide (TPR) repeat protein
MALKPTLTSFYCILLTVCGAANPAAQLASANAAYQKNDFAAAISQYETLLQQGYRSEALYYNLGNSYYRTGNLGKAVLNYERALLLDPNDEDTRHNLQLVQNKLPDDLDALPEFFLFRWWKDLSGLFSVNTWAVLAMSLLWLGAAGLIIWLLGKKRFYKKTGFILGTSSLIISGLFFFFTNDRAQEITNSGRAVVLQPEITLRSAPDAASKVVLVIHAGNTVRLLDQIGDWHKVALRNGEQGWLPKESLERI